MKQFVPLNSSEIVADKEWMDNKKVGKYDLNKYCAVRAGDFPNAYELNSMARLASAERAGSSISRFYDNCKKGNPGKKDIHSSRKIVVGLNTKRLALPLADKRKTITFTDKKGIGRFKLKRTRDLHFYSLGQIKR